MNPKLLRALTAICSLAAFITGLGAYVDLMPTAYVKLAGIALVAIMGVKDIAVIVGDIADDGIRNNSFKPPFKVLLCFLLPLFLLACASSKSTDNQLRFAQASLDAARIGYIIADSQLQTKLLDPKTPLWQRVTARTASEQARKVLDREELRVQRLIADRDAAPLPLPALLPALPK